MTRQVGAVLGSAAVGVLMQNRIAAQLSEATGGGASAESAQASSGPLPDFLKAPFADAMGQSIFLPAAVLLIGVVAVLCFAEPSHSKMQGAKSAAPAAAGH